MSNIIVTPLYGHESPETAFVVEDYPYSFRLRTTIRYWLEHKRGHGWRFVSQTMNPKTGKWNAPKAGTYNLLAEAMYLDEKGHVQARALHEYSDAPAFLEYAQTWPSMPAIQRATLALWCERKAKLEDTIASGTPVVSIGGVPQVPSQHRRDEAARDAIVWRAATEALMTAEDQALLAELRAAGMLSEAAELRTAVIQGIVTQETGA